MRKGFIPLAAIVFCGLAQNAFAAAMQVQVEKGQMRDRPSFLGKIVTTLPYGTRVEAITTKGAWTAVSSSNAQSGWLPTSALTPFRFYKRVTQSQVGTTATAQEVSLAGKGFNEQVEGRYRQQNKKLRFDLVDEIEKRSVTPQQIEHFIRQGQLHSPEGR